MTESEQIDAFRRKVVEQTHQIKALEAHVAILKSRILKMSKQISVKSVRPSSPAPYWSKIRIRPSSTFAD